MTVRKKIVVISFCIALIYIIFSSAAFEAEEAVMPEASGGIAFDTAVIELQDDGYCAVIEGQISSLAAYKDVVYNIKAADGKSVFLYQGTTKMQGKFSLRAKWEGLIPNHDYTITVATKDASAVCNIDNTFYKESYCVILDKTDEVKAMIEECKSAGLEDCAYEELAVNISEYFLPIINRRYIEKNTLVYSHQAEEIIKILDEAAENLRGYLDNSRIQRRVIPYEVGDITAEDGALYTNSDNGKRATFLTGYHIFDTEKTDFAKLKALGINHATLEISLGQCSENPGTIFIVPYGFRGPWEMDPDMYMICSEDKITADGNGAVRIISRGPQVGLTTDVQLQANHTYEFGVSVLAENDGAVKLDTTEIRFSASDKWQEIKGVYTANADVQGSISVVTNGATDGLYADNFYVREIGTNENIVVNGDFERGKIIRSEYGDFCFSVDSGWIENIKEWARAAADNGIACCVALTPHYMPGHIETVSRGVSDTGYNHNGFMIYNPTDEVYNELIRAMYDEATDILKACEGVTQLMIANEPSFTASESEFYLPKWQQFLKDRYGDTEALNSAYGGTEYNSFEEIAMPDEVSLTPLYKDYREFNDSLITQTFEWQAEYLKERVPDIEVVVKTLQSNNYIKDQYKNANDYENWAGLFEINGCDTLAYYNEDKNSLSIRGMWLDYLSSIKNAPIADLEMHSIRDGVFADVNPVIPSWTETVLWHGAMHNVYLSVPWLLNNAAWSGYGNTVLQNRPGCVAAIGKTNYDLNRLATEIGVLQSKEAKLAMFYSRENRDALTDNPRNMAKIYDVVVKNGENTDFVTESNPEALNNGQYNLLVMTDIKVISDEMLTEISEFISRDGEVVLVYSEIAKGDLLAFDTDGSAHDEQMLKAVMDSAVILNSNSLLWEYMDLQTLKNKISEATDKNVRLVNSYGNDITDCEWSYAKQGNEYIVSITNYSAGKDVTAYLEIDGEGVGSFTDLRTMTEYDGSITLSPYKPVLLKTNFVRDEFEIQGNKVLASASVVPDESMHNGMMVIALYKGNELIEVKNTEIDSSAECVLALERELAESGTYKISRFLFDDRLSPILEKEEREFIIK